MFLRYFLKLSFILFFWIGFLAISSKPVTSQDSESPLTSLENIIETVLKNDSWREISGANDLEKKRETIFRIKGTYYRILSSSDQLKVANEVKEHFEKAIEKAEEKFEEGDDSVSQSDITKMKLGLSGILNDRVELTSEIKQAYVLLRQYLGNGQKIKLPSERILPVKFLYKNFEDYKKQKGFVIGEKIGSILFSNKDIIEVDNHQLQLAFIRIVETREKMKLAKEAKKITRALLVTEVANYDFGIGDPGDLFEALIIYTRVLRGHYKAIYKFNLAVAGLEKLVDLP